MAAGYDPKGVKLLSPAVKCSENGPYCMSQKELFFVQLFFLSIQKKGLTSVTNLVVVVFYTRGAVWPPQSNGNAAWASTNPADPAPARLLVADGQRAPSVRVASVVRAPSWRGRATIGMQAVAGYAQGESRFCAVAGPQFVAPARLPMEPRRWPSHQGKGFWSRGLGCSQGWRMVQGACCTDVTIGGSKCC